MPSTMRNVIAYVRRMGAWRSAKHYWIRLLDRLEERRLGVSTMGQVALADVGVDRPEYSRYSPSSYTEFYRLMRRVAIRPEQDVFLDYGSGKGLILIAAAAFPFKRIVGLELVPAFNDIAARNFSIARPKLKCKTLQLLTADAISTIPPTDVTVAFFYHPFAQAVLQQVLQNIRTTLTEAPRQMTLIFRHPIGVAKTLESCPWLGEPSTHFIGEYEYWIVRNRRMPSD